MDEQFFAKFTKEAKDALIIAQEKAQFAGLSYVGTEHILLGVLSQENSLGATILSSFGVSLSNVDLVLKTVGRNTVSKNKSQPGGLSGFAKQVIEKALTYAHKYNHSFVGTEHLLYALVTQENTAATVILENMKIKPDHIKEQIVEMFNKTKVEPQSQPNLQGGMNPLEFFLTGLHGVLVNQDQAYQDSYKHKNSTPSKKVKSKTPTLDYFTIDLTQQAVDKKIDNVVGREEEIMRVISILNRKTKNNPVLIGEPGVGKTAIVEGLARMIVEKNVPQAMYDKRILSLSMGSVIAGTKYRGEFEERIKHIIEEATQIPNIILFIDELHTLIGAGSAEGSLDAANILKPALARAQIQLIGATTTSEYRKSIENDAALERRFQPIMVDEPTEEDAIQILMGIRHSFEDHHNLMISDEAITQSVKLSKRYINDRFLPDKAIDLIDEACALKRVTSTENKNELNSLQEKLAKIIKKKEEAVSSQNYEKAALLRDDELVVIEEIEKTKRVKIPRSKRKQINAHDIANVICRMTGVPITKLVDDERIKLNNLENILHSRIIGQSEAVSEVTKAIKRSRVGIAAHNRPIGSFIFLGPTGVGKTELVKALAQEFYNDEKALIKIDMSEFMEKHNTSRLIGTTAGYVGYEDGGQLTEQVRRKPYSVVLFDEIEKAHPEIFNLLLQILEDGYLSDSKGKKVDFSNTVIVLTSNIGAEKLNQKASPIGFNISHDKKTKLTNEYERAKKDILEELKKSFRPEFLNRIDKIVVFNPLTHENMKKIVKLHIGILQKRLDEKDMKLSISEKALDYLADIAYDPEYGARPARRKIQELIEDPITQLMVDDDLNDGDKIQITLNKKKLVIKKK